MGLPRCLIGLISLGDHGQLGLFIGREISTVLSTRSKSLDRLKTRSGTLFLTAAYLLQTQIRNSCAASGAWTTRQICH